MKETPGLLLFYMELVQGSICGAVGGGVTSFPRLYLQLSLSECLFQHST